MAHIDPRDPRYEHAGLEVRPDDGPEVYLGPPRDENVADSQEKVLPAEDRAPSVSTYGYYPHSSPSDRVTYRSDDRICGLRKKVFWILVGLAVFLVLLCLGVGVGVGVSVGAKKSQDSTGGSSSKADSTASSSSIDTSTSDGPMTIFVTTTAPGSAATSSGPVSVISGSASVSSTTTTSTTSTNTAAWASATFNAAATDCPQTHNTLYSPSGSGKTFWRRCGIDYGGDGEATDIGQGVFKTLNECIDLCAQTPGCTGASWGHFSSESLQTCYLKKDLIKSHVATLSDWSFAMLT